MVEADIGFMGDAGLSTDEIRSLPLPVCTRVPAIGHDLFALDLPAAETPPRRAPRRAPRGGAGDRVAGAEHFMILQVDDGPDRNAIGTTVRPLSHAAPR